jgi:hypothetical protein
MEGLVISTLQTRVHHILWKKPYGREDVCKYTLIVFLDIIHRPVFYLEHKETEFCLCLQAKAYSVGPTGRASPYLRLICNVQNHKSSINIPLSQTFRSYFVSMFEFFTGIGMLAVCQKTIY